MSFLDLQRLLEKPDEPPAPQQADEPPAPQQADEPPAPQQADEPPAQQAGDQPAQADEPPAWARDIAQAVAALSSRVDELGSAQSRAEDGYKRTIESLVKYGVAGAGTAGEGAAGPQPPAGDPLSGGYTPLRKLDVLPADFRKKHGMEG